MRVYPSCVTIWRSCAHGLCNRLYGGRGVPHRLFPLAGAKADLPPRLPWAELFTRVRGRRILRTSLFGDSQKFKFVSNGVLRSSQPALLCSGALVPAVDKRSVP